MSDQPTPPRVTVDPSVCIASEQCVRLAGGVFELVDGVAQVTDPSGATLEKLQLAERSCPTGAITVDQP